MTLGRLRNLVLIGLLPFLGAGCFASASLWIGAAPAPQAVDVVIVGDDVSGGDVSHVSVFYDPLAPWGAWEQDPELGWIWSPSDVEYVPYRDGYWVDTDAGPVWFGEEPYGWATAHYGRWFWRDRWYWVPDVEWAPAWVEWRVGEGAVGWAPLGPAGRGGADWPVPVDGWSFVSASDFYTHGLAMRRATPSYAGWFLYRTRPWVRWAAVGGAHRYVVGPRVEIAGRQLAPRVRLASLPPDRVRWMPRWNRPAIPRHYASVRAGPDGPVRIPRAEPADRIEPIPQPWSPHEWRPAPRYHRRR